MDILVGSAIGFGILTAGVVIAPTVKFAMDMAPYLYTNTRCAAKSGMILTKKDYDSMISAASFEEMLTLLEETSYSYAAEHGKNFSEVSLILEKELYDTYFWLSDVVPDKVKNIIKSMILKFEVNEIKEALNNVKSGKEHTDLNFISDNDLKLKIESSNDFSSFVSAFEGTKYEKIFSGKDISKIAEINSELDVFFINSVMLEIASCKDKKAGEAFSDYWKKMVDLSNIRLALRKISSGDDKIKLIGGGVIPVKELSGISDDNQLEELLSNTPYKEFISDSGNFGIENAFFKFLKKEAGLLNAKYPFKGGSIIQFIINKELEIRNLNVTLKLKSEEFSADEISGLLVI